VWLALNHHLEVESAVEAPPMNHDPDERRWTTVASETATRSRPETDRRTPITITSHAILSALDDVTVLSPFALGEGWFRGSRSENVVPSPRGHGEPASA
jgi:hypothetical protein